jgi:hypothetical protein
MKRRKEMNKGKDNLDHDQQDNDPFEPMARSILEQSHEHLAKIRQESHLFMKTHQSFLDLEVAIEKRV